MNDEIEMAEEIDLDVVKPERLTAGQLRLADLSKDHLGEHVQTTLDELVEFAQVGSLSIEPLFLRHEQGDFLVIRHTHGFYALTEHLDGSVLLLYSHDNHMFDPLVHCDDAFREKCAPGFWLDPANTNHIEVVEARPAKNGEKWVMQAINKHNYAETNNLERFGYLWHPTKDLYESGSIAYRFEDVDSDDKKIKKRKKKLFPDDPEQEAQLLRCYTTEGKQNEFSEFNHNFLSSVWGRMQTSSCLTTLVPPQSMFKETMNDFLRRSELVFRGIDPSRLGYLRKEVDFQSILSPHRKGFFKSIGPIHAVKTGLGRIAKLAHMLFLAKKDKKRKGMVRKTATTVATALTIAAVQFLSRGAIIAVMKFFTIVLGPLAKPFVAIFSAPQIPGIFHSAKNVAEKYQKPDYLKAKGDGYYSVIDPKQAPLCKFMHPQDTHAQPFLGGELEERVRDDFAAHKLLDPYGAPAGSFFEKRRINNADTLRIVQPDGIELYILVGKKVAYARYRPEFANDFAQPMHRKIHELLIKTDNYVRVFEKDGKIQYEDIDSRGFINGINAETIVPYDGNFHPDPLHSIHILQNEWNRSAPPPPSIKKSLKKSIVSIVASKTSNDNDNDSATDAPADEENSKPTKRQAANEWAQKELKCFEEERRKRSHLIEKMNDKQPASQNIMPPRVS